jgi:hypothetical protein
MWLLFLLLLHNRMLMGGTSAPSSPARKSSEYGAVNTSSATTTSEEEGLILHHDDTAEREDADAPQRPKIDPCLWVFHFVEGLTAISALFLLLTQIAPVLLLKKETESLQQQQHGGGGGGDNAHPLSLTAIVERLYLTIFCLLVIVTESSAPIPIVRDSQILQNYCSRGFLYSFIGIICLEEAYSERVKGLLANVANVDGFHIAWAALFMEFSAWLMLAMGMLYMVLGILCLKLLRDRMVEREKKHWKTFRQELAEWRKTKREQHL